MRYSRLNQHASVCSGFPATAAAVIVTDPIGQSANRQLCQPGEWQELQTLHNKYTGDVVDNVDWKSICNLVISLSQQVLDNPSYDPNIYQTFVPQDAVQQYVQQYGGQYMPQTAYSSNYDPAGFTVQTGYEGFLVPAEPPAQSSSLFPALIRSLPLPKSIATLIMKVGAFLISSVGVVVAGGFLTTLLCTFTPVCKIALLAPIFGIAKNNQVAETIAETVAENVTAERVKRAAEFVRNALEKYAQLNMELNPKPSVTAKVSPAAVEEDTSA